MSQNGRNKRHTACAVSSLAAGRQVTVASHDTEIKSLITKAPTTGVPFKWIVTTPASYYLFLTIF
jgi:hypothetical protein